MNNIGHGQVWWADLDDAKIRPVVILTRSWVAPKLRRVLVAPITSTIRGIPCEVPLGREEGLDIPCVVNLDNSQLLDVDRLLEPLGSLQARRWPEVCLAMQHAIGC